MKSKSEKPFRIHVDKHGRAHLDIKKFLARPEVQRKHEIMCNIDIEGKKLVGDKLVSIDDNDSARKK